MGRSHLQGGSKCKQGHTDHKGLQVDPREPRDISLFQPYFIGIKSSKNLLEYKTL